MSSPSFRHGALARAKRQKAQRVVTGRPVGCLVNTDVGHVAAHCGELYREQIDQEVGGDPRASTKARRICAGCSERYAFARRHCRRSEGPRGAGPGCELADRNGCDRRLRQSFDSSVSRRVLSGLEMSSPALRQTHLAPSSIPISPKDRIDASLVTGSLGFEPLQYFSVDAQRHRPLGWNDL